MTKLAGLKENEMYLIVSADYKIATSSFQVYETYRNHEDFESVTIMSKESALSMCDYSQ